MVNWNGTKGPLLKGENSFLSLSSLKFRNLALVELIVILKIFGQFLWLPLLFHHFGNRFSNGIGLYPSCSIPVSIIYELCVQ